MSNHQGRVNRPYRKASEYLAASNNATGGTHLSSNREHDVLNQKIIALTRKLERTEAELAQSREYFNNELHRFEEQQFKINDQYRKLQSSYAALQLRDRELEQKLMKANTLQMEKECLVREVNEISNKLTETRNLLLKTQEENERLRKDCNLAVQLLKCNRPSYQAQQPERLPSEVQDQIDTYKVELHHYNEYINPYADASDSESEVERVKNPATLQFNQADNNSQNKSNEIPVEFLAEALKKPENVHLNLEPSDYIHDPVLHSVYKAHYTERKLVKPDYNQRATASRETAQQSAAPPKQEENSPWEFAPSRHAIARRNESVDDESPAGAYGAYSISSRRKARPKTHRIDRPEISSRNKSPNGDAPTAPSQLQRPPSPDDLCFRAPSEPPRSGISGYFNKAAKNSPAVSVSSSSSKKSTPVRVRGKEKATTAETSSLLNQSQSDEDAEIMVEISHYPNKQINPQKRYSKEAVGDQEKSSLLAHDDEAQYELPPPPSEIDLEWEPEITENPEPHHPVFSHAQESESARPTAHGAQPDLLLSYAQVESPVKSVTSDMEALMGDESVKYEDESLLDSKQYLPPPNPGGQLLSEIVTNNPSLSNFLMTTAPPPPQQYASRSEQTTFGDPILHEESLTMSRETYEFRSHETSNSSPTDKSGIELASLPVRVDDQVEVIDLDEEPRKRGNRRRNSFEQARELGNVLNYY